MPCKRCGREDHVSAASRACPENLITKKILSWNGNCLADSVITHAVIAGFFDADGHYNESYGSSLYQSHQFGLDVLDLIRTYLGRGTIYGPRRDGQYTLSFRSRENMDEIKQILYGYGVIKGMPFIRTFMISDEWLGGFFAGDGCARKDLKGGRVISIGQQSHPLVLHAIRDYLGYGKVKENREWMCFGADAERFAERFKNFALHKRVDLIKLLL